MNLFNCKINNKKHFILPVKRELHYFNVSSFLYISVINMAHISLYCALIGSDFMHYSSREYLVLIHIMEIPVEYYLFLSL